jgi:endonuclease/exonuclease/phosphatase (EEP) superfamily protein YafD
MPEPLLIAGDFNTTPHSPHFTDLINRSGLRSAALGRHWAPTWPTFFMPAGIQIDHVLVSDGVAVKRFETGPAVGSDHLPIIVDLLL